MLSTAQLNLHFSSSVNSYCKRYSNNNYYTINIVSNFLPHLGQIREIFINVVVLQSLSHVQLFATPWTTACQASLSFTISQSFLELMSISTWSEQKKNKHIAKKNILLDINGKQISWTKQKIVLYYSRTRLKWLRSSSRVLVWFKLKSSGQNSN